MFVVRRAHLSVVLCWVCVNAQAYAQDAAPAVVTAGAAVVRIPAGTFVQGSNDGAEDERPRRERSLPAFRIDRTETTRGAYRRCVAAKRCAAVAGVDGKALDAEAALLPVTNVSWAEAARYCQFVKGRLPTEAQWERAARGVDGRAFPWGNELSCAHANWGNFADEGPCAGVAPGHPVAVGSYPLGATPEGVVDLAGNVWEWVDDKYEADRSRRVVKGGSCCSYFVEPRTANRNAWAPTHRDEDLGFRCAYR
jgi:formylglycine-generating enzyme required for sulfatase activity